MIETLMGLASSSGVGALIGLFGSWMTKREERKNRELDYAHEIKMADIRMRELEAEQNHELAVVDKNIQKAEAEGDIKIDLAEMEAFTESQETTSDFADSVRACVRPFILFYLLIGSTWIFFKVGAEIDGLESLPAADLLELYSYVVYQIVGLTSLAVSWYYGSRPSSIRRT